MDTPHGLILKKRTQVAEATLEMVFEFADQGFHFIPGQYIWLIIELTHPDERGNRRAFSLACPPTEKNITLIVRQSESGFKKTLLDMPIGSKAECIGPFGSFFFPTTADMPIYLVAGGVAISPFLSMLRAMNGQTVLPPVKLFYANKTPERAAYQHELLQFRDTNPWFSVEFITGHINLDRFFPQPTDATKGSWYVVGPEAMCEAVGRQLITWQVPDKQLFFDEYWPIDQRISELRDKLVTSEAYKIAVQCSSNHIIITDVNGRVVFANAAAEHITGYSFAEMENQTPRLWGGLMPAEFYRQLWHRVKVEKKSFIGEITNRRKNGDHYRAFSHISPIMGEGNELLGFIATEEDISVRVQVEEKLATSEARFRALIEKGADMISLVNGEGKIVYQSPSIRAVLGYSEEELLGEGITYHLTHPDDLPIVEEMTKKVMTQPGSSVTYQARVKHKDGTWRWIETIATNMLESVAVKGVVFNFRDITFRKEAEESLKKKADELQIAVTQLQHKKAKDDALLQSIGEGVVAVDEEGKIAFVNATTERLFNRPATELLGQNYFQSIKAMNTKKEVLPLEQRAIHLAISEKRQIKDEYYLVRDDGTTFIASVTATPVILGDTVTGAIQVIRDITREKEIDQMKTEFISLASHQLRTPLSAMRWFAEMLKNGTMGELSPEQLECVQNIYDSNDRMIALVNSLLNISRIESGRIIIEPQPTPLEDLLRAVTVELKPLADARQQEVTVVSSGDIPDVNLDRRLIHELASNLLTNSMKYSPEHGQISIHLTKENDQVLLEFRDSGYGIPTKDQDRVFQKFYRGENILKMQTDGTGLGLYLVKAIVESSGGTIWFTSEEGKGTSFFVRLPIAGVPPKAGEVVLNPST